MEYQIDQFYQRLNHIYQGIANEKGIEIRLATHYIDFNKNNQTVRIAIRHSVYVLDVINSFDYYFSAVEPIDFNNRKLVDYSIGRYHDVVGFTLFPVYFPSLSEPTVTTTQYLEFADLKPGGTVIDLGAYAGLTSILFKESVGATGKVVAVEADEQNVVAMNKNFNLYHKFCDGKIEVLFGAAWNHCNGLQFSSEGNMGSSASDIVGNDRGNVITTPSFTLSKIADLFQLESVDFIKCDIEGGEVVVFQDQAFFEKFRPRIIIETHLVENHETTDVCIKDLEAFGYTCKRIHQTGVTLPLLECYPPIN